MTTIPTMPMINKTTNSSSIIKQNTLLYLISSIKLRTRSSNSNRDLSTTRGSHPAALTSITTASLNQSSRQLVPYHITLRKVKDRRQRRIQKKMNMLMISLNRTQRLRSHQRCRWPPRSVSNSSLLRKQHRPWRPSSNQSSKRHIHKLNRRKAVWDIPKLPQQVAVPLISQSKIEYLSRVNSSKTIHPNYQATTIIRWKQSRRSSRRVRRKTMKMTSMRI